MNATAPAGAQKETSSEGGSQLGGTAFVLSREEGTPNPETGRAPAESDGSDGESSTASWTATGTLPPSPDCTVTAAEAAVLAEQLPGGGVKGSELLATLEDAVAMTGRGKFHFVLLLVSGSLVMASVLETVVVGYLLPSASCELRMSDGDKGLLGAASYAGVVVSSHAWGLLADTQGRRRALAAAMLLTALASLASSLAPGFPALLALRFLCGVFSSAPGALSFAYLGEFHTPESRSQAILWVAAFPSIGLIILPGVAWLVLPQAWRLELGWVRFGPWRLLLLLSALLSLLAAALMFLLGPESPKFLHARDPEGALRVLRRMYAWNSGRPPEDYPVKGLLPAPAAPASPPRPLKDAEKGGRAPLGGKGAGAALRVAWQQTAPLFQPPLLPYTALVCTIQFGNLASANGLQIWLPDIFNALALYEETHPDDPAWICASREQLVPTPAAGTSEDIACGPVKDEVFVNNIIVGVVSLVAPILCGFIVNLVGKRNLLVACLLLTGSLAVCLTVAASSSAVLALASVIVAINAMGISHVSSVVVELFPTRVRAMAVSLHLMVGRVGSIVGNLIFGALLRSHCPVAFYTIGGALLGCAVLSCFLPARGKHAA